MEVQCNILQIGLFRVSDGGAGWGDIYTRFGLVVTWLMSGTIVYTHTNNKCRLTTGDAIDFTPTEPTLNTSQPSLARLPKPYLANAMRFPPLQLSMMQACLDGAAAVPPQA